MTPTEAADYLDALAVTHGRVTKRAADKLEAAARLLRENAAARIDAEQAVQRLNTQRLDAERRVLGRDQVVEVIGDALEDAERGDSQVRLAPPSSAAVVALALRVARYLTRHYDVATREPMGAYDVSSGPVTMTLPADASNVGIKFDVDRG